MYPQCNFMLVQFLEKVLDMPVVVRVETVLNTVEVLQLQFLGDVDVPVGVQRLCFMGQIVVCQRHRSWSLLWRSCRLCVTLGSRSWCSAPQILEFIVEVIQLVLVGVIVAFLVETCPLLRRQVQFSDKVDMPVAAATGA